MESNAWLKTLKIAAISFAERPSATTAGFVAIIRGESHLDNLTIDAGKFFMRELECLCSQHRSGRNH
jgi:hypothetical protein